MMSDIIFNDDDACNQCLYIDYNTMQLLSIGIKYTQS